MYIFICSILSLWQLMHGMDSIDASLKCIVILFIVVIMCILTRILKYVYTTYVPSLICVRHALCICWFKVFILYLRINRLIWISLFSFSFHFQMYKYSTSMLHFVYLIYIKTIDFRSWCLFAIVIFTHYQEINQI